MNFLIALLAGAASAFAFAPFGWWPLLPLAFAAFGNFVVGGNFVVRPEDEALARTVADTLMRDLEAAGYPVTDGGI